MPVSIERSEVEEYIRICQTKFWKDIFRFEIDYILETVAKEDEILSVGCGPAIIERTLSDRGFKITGLDVSMEALKRAPDNLRAVAGRAEQMPFSDSSFDVVIYVASLQFIKNYKKAIDRTTGVLRPNGLLILMLLNTESSFVKEKMKNPDSYMSKMKHRDLKEIQSIIEKKYDIETEYQIGVKGEHIFESRDRKSAALFIIRGRKKNKV